MSKNKNNIGKPIDYDQDYLDGVDIASNIIISKLSPKVANIVRKRMSKGGSTNDEPKPTNVIQFPEKPGNMGLWWKTASADDIKELLSPVFSEKELHGLTDTELKELLQYTLDTGGIG